MHFNQALMEAVLPAMVVGLLSILGMAAMLRWWRGRIDAHDSADMRSRIASAAPDPHLQTVELRRPGAVPGLSSSFVGRDRSALPLE